MSRLPNLKAIIFEIFQTFIEMVGRDVIFTQLERLQELWELRGTAVGEPLSVRSWSLAGACADRRWSFPGDVGTCPG